MLSLKQITDICLAFDTTHARCRYLCQDDNDPKKFYCLKLSSKAEEIDKEIQSYMNDCQSKKHDPLNDNFPLSDNCEGYPILRHIEQGYDC